MTVKTQPLAEVTQSAIHLLCRELGIVNAIRFLNQYTQGHGNYTEERDQLFGHLTVQDIVQEIRLHQQPIQ
jgi:hypothetical protein